jgi:hypothetical protein
MERDRVRLAFIFTTAMLAGSAFAADPFYLGVWKMTSAVVAAWSDAERKPYVAESKTLVGKMVTIKPGEILGPHAVACKGLHYKLSDVAANMLFQGSFDEMRRRDKSADPVKLAAKLGFHGPTSKVLETGCGNELDLHFVDPATAEFGLNNYVYILKKQ